MPTGTAISGWCVYLWGPWVSLGMIDEFSLRATKITSRIDIPWTHSLPFCFWPIFNYEWIILSKGCKRHNLSHNSLKLSFINIWGLQLNFVSFLQLISPDILALWEINLDDLTDSDNFSVWDYLALIQKDSVAHMHCLAVYVKEGLPFVHNLPLENSTDSHLSVWLALYTSLSILLLFPLSITFFVFMHGFWFYIINIDEILLINQSTCIWRLYCPR